MSTPYAFARANRARFLEEYQQLLRMRTISTQPQHAQDVAEAAEWLRDMMLRIGMTSAEVILMPQGRCPLVLGEWNGAGEHAPTALIYSHYDVQPAEIADGWRSEPFEPTIIGERLYCRGAVDSKLHVMANLKAVEAWLAADDKPAVNLKVVLEGEEESGSENINAFIAAHPERLAADIAVVSDGAILAPEQPSLTYGLRGALALELAVHAPASDLHSGHWGGSVHNPLQALCEILAQLHDETGAVNVPGFYDDVAPLSPQDRQLLEQVEPFLQAEWDDVVAAPAQWGEPQYSLPERLGARPTLEINGMIGGYTGPGMKTVLPAKASAKITCRLVPQQDPARVMRCLVEHIETIAPPTVRVEVMPGDFGARAVLLDVDGKAMRAAAQAYAHAWGAQPVYERSGGSVPICFGCMQVADEVVIMSYGLKSGRAHGPNENIYLQSFYNGIEAMIKFIEALGA
ncbi:MAG: M20/M25/M40 family metallo-hydrolase [Chloroflexi bacterium]|nr:M20/M25/M40 family metallo-hydrolase [Chloroflexota bacterium]MCY4246910.1 M20/M25/M40 family metallo-hydrolase [Chloroflexota bacterium]